MNLNAYKVFFVVILFLSRAPSVYASERLAITSSRDATVSAERPLSISFPEPEKAIAPRTLEPGTRPGTR